MSSPLSCMSISSSLQSRHIELIRPQSCTYVLKSASKQPRKKLQLLSPTQIDRKVIRGLQGESSLKRHPIRRAALLDESPPWTPDQIAGLAFGVFLLLCVYFAKEVDTIVARSQRRQLGLCEECGGLFNPETCKEWRCPYKDEEGK